MIINTYGQTIVDDTYQFMHHTQEDVFQGWSFGIQTNVGVVYELWDDFSLGIQVNGQSDITTLEPTEGQFVNGSQRINNLGSFGFVFLFDL